jgi:hypothetical protein
MTRTTDNDGKIPAGSLSSAVKECNRAIPWSQRRLAYLAGPGRGDCRAGRPVLAAVESGPPLLRDASLKRPSVAVQADRGFGRGFKSAGHADVQFHFA